MRECSPSARFPRRCLGVGLTPPAPEHLAFYAGVAAMAVFGIMEWPVVTALVVGHTLVYAQHNMVFQSLGEALEEA
jgi:predicted membrane protein